MATQTHANRTFTMVAYQRLIDGLTANKQTLSSFFIDGKALTVDEVIAILKARIDGQQRVLDSRATWQEALRSERQQESETAEFVVQLRQTLKVAFASSVDQLARYGLTPTKARVISPEKSVAATAKARATRLARHTMGPKQKKAITGDPTRVAVTPVTAAPTTAPTTPLAK
jgi:hypothetical protein